MDARLGAMRGYDDFGVQNALLAKEECELKEKIWVELNKDYLREQEGKIFPFFLFSFFFLISPPLQMSAVIWLTWMDIIVTRLNKETDLRNGIIKTAKKPKRNKPRDSNSQ